MADGNNVTKGLSCGHMELLTKTSMKAEPQLPVKIPENIECKIKSDQHLISFHTILMLHYKAV